MTGVWNTPGIVDRLLELNAEAPSATQMARTLEREFSVTLSRNSVIGKLNRMGPGMKTAGNFSSAATRKPQTKKPSAAKPRPRVTPEAAPIPLCAPGAFAKDGECRFIEGEISARDADGNPTWQMCGHPAAKPGVSWCHYHAWESPTPVFDRGRTVASQTIAATTDAKQDASMRRMGLG